MNIVCLIGNIGNDPDTKYFESGTSKTTFSIAISKYVKDKDPVTMWVNCEAWGKVAEVIANHFKKGSKIGIEGRLDVQTWTAPDGQSRSKMVVIVDKPSFCERKADGQPSQRTQAQPKAQQQSMEHGEVDYSEIGEDEIPF